jgi:hypothetical protein
MRSHNSLDENSEIKILRDYTGRRYEGVKKSSGTRRDDGQGQRRRVWSQELRRCENLVVGEVDEDAGLAVNPFRSLIT